MAELVASFLVSDYLEQRTTWPCWTLGTTISIYGATWVGKLLVLLGAWFQRVPVCNMITSEMDVLFWYLICLGISGPLVWIQGPETFFDCSTSSCLPVPCRSQTWLPRWQTLFSWWIHWLFPDWRGSVSAWNPCGEFILCPVGTEVVTSWNRHGCCARTLLLCRKQIFHGK